MRAEYDDIDPRKLVAVEPEAFPNDAFESIPLYGTPRMLFGNSQTESGPLRSVGAIEHHETGFSCS